LKHKRHLVSNILRHIR